MRSNSSKPRVFPDQSCSAGVAMRSAALVRDRFVAARGGCVDTPAPLVGRGLPRAKGAMLRTPGIPSHRAQLRTRGLAAATACWPRGVQPLACQCSQAYPGTSRKPLAQKIASYRGGATACLSGGGATLHSSGPRRRQRRRRAEVGAEEETLDRGCNRLLVEGVQPLAGRGGATLHSSNSLTFFSNALTFFCVQGVEVDSLREEERRPWTGGGVKTADR